VAVKLVWAQSRINPAQKIKMAMPCLVIDSSLDSWFNRGEMLRDSLRSGKQSIPQNVDSFLKIAALSSQNCTTYLGRVDNPPQKNAAA